jgi:hypothetical protein
MLNLSDERKIGYLPLTRLNFKTLWDRFSKEKKTAICNM